MLSVLRGHSNDQNLTIYHLQQGETCVGCFGQPASPHFISTFYRHSLTPKMATTPKKIGNTKTTKKKNQKNNKAGHHCKKWRNQKTARHFSWAKPTPGGRGAGMLQELLDIQAGAEGRRGGGLIKKKHKKRKRCHPPLKKSEGEGAGC